MDAPTPVAVVTDLDGTLLDHDTYRPGPAAAAVTELQAAGVVIVCCSAKTRAEQDVHRAELGITGPYIVENGAAVLPDDDADPVVLGRDYAAVRSGLASAASALGITVRGFGDMPVDEVAGRTGLTPAAAARARDREYTEAFVVTDGAASADDLARALADQQLTLHRGARFWTAAGDHDKGRAVRRVRVLLGDASGAGPLLFGIGDAENDVPMLAAVDRPLLVARPGGGWSDVQVPGLERLDGVGPVGWRTMADRILSGLRD